MTRVALLWHMHQPAYTDPVTGEAILPWVRLHATHSYNDMAAMLERHPAVKATVNFVPCLVEQLEAAANGTVRERYLELSRARAEELGPEERAFVARQFFMIDHERNVRPVPRYRELLERRQAGLPFDAQAIRDLQVHFNLAWMGFAARAEEPDVARLVAKGRDYDEADKAALLDAQQRIVRNVLGRWRRLVERGQVEPSATPYFHPILPLVCDSDAARRAMPHAALPPRFSWPEDARLQVRLALESHERTFGKRPTGMWPAEGSVSPEALEVLAAEGVKWVATDEGVLFRSVPSPTHRGQLYQGFHCSTAHGPISVAFRDRGLSDRIGFTYARMDPDAAVSDFVALLHGSAHTGRAAHLSDPLVPVVLDGENAWERYPGHGEAFLDKLHRVLAERFETVTMSEALARPTGRLERIHSGSWIDANYRIWIGHPEDNLAWELLGQVRALLARHEAAGDVAPEKLERARRLLLSAEGSDWFWWYGDDFDTENAAEFDALFRERLRLAASLLGEPAPWRLSEPISARARGHAAASETATPPTMLLRPHIDGRSGVWGDWLGAGSYSPGGGRGSMYQGESLVRALLFGFDRERLYLRLDTTSRLAPATLHLHFERATESRDVRVEIEGPGALAVGIEGGEGAYQEAVELAVPFASLGARPGERMKLTVSVRRGADELERVPRESPLELECPDENWERRHWLV